MNNEANNAKQKTVRKSVRLSEDMNKLFSIMAKEHGTNVSKYLRDSAFLMAEMSLDEQEILNLIKDKDKLRVQKKFNMLFQETKDIVINSTSNLYEYLAKRLDRIEKVTELFLYVFLFHNPALTEHQKEDAAKSAVKRKREILKYVDQMVEKMQKERNGE